MLPPRVSSSRLLPARTSANTPTYLLISKPPRAKGKLSNDGGRDAANTFDTLLLPATERTKNLRSASESFLPFVYNSVLLKLHFQKLHSRLRVSLTGINLIENCSTILCWKFSNGFLRDTTDTSSGPSTLNEREIIFNKEEEFTDISLEEFIS